jgi:heme/copper-type cytochrome/quinol oxidase subunit 2
MALYLVFTGAAPYAAFAENLVSFYGVFLFVLGIVGIFAIKHAAQKTIDDGEYEPRSKLRTTYANVTTFVEVIVVAAFGWYWVTAGFVLGWLAVTSYRAEVKRLFELKEVV